MLCCAVLLMQPVLRGVQSSIYRGWQNGRSPGQACLPGSSCVEASKTLTRSWTSSKRRRWWWCQVTAGTASYDHVEIGWCVLGVPDDYKLASGGHILEDTTLVIDRWCCCFCNFHCNCELNGLSVQAQIFDQQSPCVTAVDEPMCNSC